MSPVRRGGGTRKPAGRGAAKKSASKSAPKRSAAKPGATKSSAAKPEVARNPRLELVKRAPRVSPAVRPESFGQASGASNKQRVLFEMVRARAAVLAAIQGLTGGSADQPRASGAWSVRETVLLLCAWDDMSLRALESALHGIPPEWAARRGAKLEPLDTEGVNALRHHGWDEALRLLQWSRQRLMESAEGIADEPAQVWEASHPLGALLSELAERDRRHAEAIKRWRTSRER